MNNEKSLWYLNIKWLEGVQRFDWCYIKLGPSTSIFMQRCVCPFSADTYFPFFCWHSTILTNINEPNMEWKHPFECHLWLTSEGIWVCFSAWLHAGLILSGRANHGTACTNCTFPHSLLWVRGFCNTEMSHILNPSCWNHSCWWNEMCETNWRNYKERKTVMCFIEKLYYCSVNVIHSKSRLK